MTTDLWNNFQTLIKAQAKQLIGSTLRKRLLVLSTRCHDSMRHAAVTKQLQKKVKCSLDGPQALNPSQEILTPAFWCTMLPREVGGQVKFASSTRNADSASNTHQPLIRGQTLTRFARLLIECLVGLIDAVDELLKRIFGNLRIPSVARQNVPVTFQFFEYVRFEIRTRGHVHDFKDCDQCKMVIYRAVARHELAQAFEQMFEPEHGADALVERIFVQNQGRAFRAVSATRIVSHTGCASFTKKAEVPERVHLRFKSLE